MKLKYTYLFFVVIGAWIMLRSNSAGRGSNTQACGAAGCHAPASQAIGATNYDSIFLIDKATGNPVTSWIAGQSYNIGFIGNYAGASVLPKFGFQIDNGGKGSFSGIPANTNISSAGGISYWGHTAPKDTFASIPIPPILNISIYLDSATWTAPATGSGPVTFTGRLNAVNNTSTAGGDKPTGANYTRTYNEATSLVASVNIFSGGGPNICAGQRKNFQAIPMNGGTPPAYQWYINSTPVGTNKDTFSSNSLVSSDTVYVIMTSSLSGVTGSPATSNKIIINVNPVFNNQVTVAANKTVVCAGDTAVFTATPSAGSAGTQYRWYVKNTLVQGPSPSPTYTKIGFATGDSIWCSLQVNNPCASPNRDTSNSVLMTISSSPVVTPPVSKILCSGDSSKTNKWTSSMSGTTYTWTNSDPTIGLMASGTGDSLPWFNAINTTGANKTATITIRSFGSGCSGAPVSFTISVRPIARVRPPLTSTNFCHGLFGNMLMLTQPFTGTTVSWTNNNTNTGIPASGTTNNINFTATNSTASDSIIATITARATLGTCTGPDTTFTVTVFKLPVVTQPADISVCHQDAVSVPTFSSNFANASYSWINSNPTIGLVVSGNGNISTFLANNTGPNPKTAIISVTGNYKNCPSTVKSFNITVNPQVPSIVTISSPDTLMCPGGSSIITANPSNGGTSPSYEWYRNGSIISGITNINTITNVMDNDQVYCIMTGNSTCTTNPIDTSNTIVIKTTNAIKPNVSISTSTTNICSGDPVTFNTTISSGGASPSYQWLKNGAIIAGATTDYYLIGTLSHLDKISCIMTSSLSCAVPQSDTSDELIMKVFPKIFPTLSLDKNKTKICSDDIVIFYPVYKDEGVNPKFEWFVNGVDMGSNPISLYHSIVSSSDVVEFKMTAAEPCAIPKISTATISVDTVLQGPIVGVEPNKYIAFCEGDSSLVQAFGGQPNYRFIWSTGDTTRTFISKKSQSFILTVTEPGNVCPRKYGPLTTYANPIPAAPEITRNGNILRASPANNYQWQLDGFDIVGANFQTYTFSIIGKYTVKTVNNAGCANKSTEFNTQSSGISNQSIEGIYIFPNPSNGIVQIHSKNEKINQVSVYNLLGKLVFQDSKIENDKSITLDNQAKGDYIILIQTNKSSHRSKLELR